jgi:hypothetical protein
MGVESIHDIPDDFELTEIQRRAADVRANGGAVVQPELGAELEWAEYPLYFADFETVNPAFPDFRACDLTINCRFSGVCMCSRARRRTGAPRVSRHRCSDPRREFIESLCAALGESGSIVVYSSFESQRLSELAVGCRNSQIGSTRSKPACSICCPSCGTRLSSGIRRLVLDQVGLACARAGDDLRRHGRSRTGRTPGWLGSRWCVGAWMRGERDRIRKALLDYCGQDTLAVQHSYPC